MAVLCRGVGDPGWGPGSLVGTYPGIRAVSEDNCLFPHPGEPRAEQQFEVKALGGADYLDCDEDILQLQLPGRGPDGFSRGSPVRSSGTGSGGTEGRGAPCTEGYGRLLPGTGTLGS